MTPRTFHLILILGLLAGVAAAQTPNPSSNQAPIEDHIFRINFSGSEVQLDPHRGQTAEEAQLFTAFYEGLVTYDPLSLRPSPGAAQKWEFSEDGKTVTFTLRDGLQFDDGTPLTNQDFIESWFRVLDPKDPGPFASLLDDIKGVQAWRLGELSDRSKVGIKTVGTNKLVIELLEPAPHILSILSHYSFVPVHPSLRNGTSGAFPIGDGPFKISQLEKNRWILVKNLYYWDRRNVKLPKIELTFRDDYVKVTQDFKEGRYDWLADGLDGNTNFNPRLLSATPLFGTSFLFFNTGKAPWNNEKVRRALILALPLEEIRKAYLQPTSVLIPGFEGYPSPQGLEKQNKEEALRLLKEAGFPKGKNLPALRYAFPAVAGDDENKLAEALKTAWKEELGLDFEPVPVEGSYYDKLGQLDYAVGFFSWIGDFLDPMTFLVLWKGGSSLNSFGFSEKEYDQLLTEASRQTSDERLKTLSKAEGYLLQKGLLVPLGHTPGFNLIDRDSVGGWYPNPLDIHPFKSLYLKPPKPIKNVVQFDLE